MIRTNLIAPRVRGSAMAMPQRLTFGELLKRYRAAAHLTQDELAERARLSAKAISALERGERQAPRRETVALLAEALRLSESEREQFIAAARQHAAPMVSTSPAVRPALWPPLVGREQEQAAIKRQLTQTQAPLLLVSGEPGIGKTRLLQETRAWATAQGWTAVQGGCHRRSGQEPYAPFADLLSRWLASRSAAQRRLDLQGCAWLARLLPELAESEVIPAPSWTLPPEQERRLMFAAAATLLRNVAGPQGTLLLLDDAQWAGTDALDLLAALLRGSAAESSTPVKAVVAFRDTEVEPTGVLATLLPDLTREGLAVRLALKPLDEAHSAELVEQLLLSAADDSGDRRAVKRQLVQRAGGVPYYLVSCAQGVEAETLLDGESAFSVPWTVATSIRARLSALPQSAQQLLGIAAVAGRQTPRAVLIAASGLSQEEALLALEITTRALLLVDGADGDDGLCAFPHDLIHEVIASDLTAGRRERLHLVVAEAMERLARHNEHAAELAWHYAQGGSHERSLPYALLAGDQAEVVYAHAEAELQYRMALRLASELGDRVQETEALEKLGGTLALLGRNDEARTLLDRALRGYASSEDQVGELRALATLLTLTFGRSMLEEAVARAQSILGRVEPMDASIMPAVRASGLAAVYSSLAHLNFTSGRYDEAVRDADQATGLARQAGDERLLAQALLQRYIADAAQGQWTDIDLLEELRALAERSGESAVATFASMMMAHRHELDGAFAQMMACVEYAVEQAERRQDQRSVAEYLGELASCAFSCGDWQRARAAMAHVETIMREVNRHGAGFVVMSSTLVSGALALAEGREQDGRHLLEEAIDEFERVGATFFLRWPTCALAEADILAGRPEQARLRLAALLARPGMSGPQARTLAPLLAWAEGQLGLEAEAAARLEILLADAEPLIRVDALRIQGLLATMQGRWDVATTLLDEALDSCRIMPHPYAEAKALWVYGRLERVRGYPGAARKRFTDALVISDRLGEGMYRAQISRDLAGL
jgi:predicted ATPase/DNA-binding XRE family transcriptional regulator